MKKVFIFFLGFLLTVSIGVTLLQYFSSTSVALLEPHIDDIDSVAASELGTPGPSPYVVYEPLTIDSIFQSANLKKFDDDKVTILATGDIIPARVTNAKMKEKGVDYPFTDVDALLKNSDLTVVNLEAPLLSNCSTTLVGMTFCGTGDFAAAMKRHGVGLATLENNHIGNYGMPGIEETKKLLNKADVPFARFDSPFITTIKGQTFGFLPVNGVGPAINKPLLAERITNLKAKVDVVVVCVHWGKEYTYDPVAAPGIAPDDPQEIGHLMIDSGADVVFGNHPHWVQGVELYKEGFIAYGHGNFIFDQEWSPETKEGVVGGYTFVKGKLVDVQYTPIVIEDFAKPRLATDSEGKKILDSMKLSSVKLSHN